MTDDSLSRRTLLDAAVRAAALPAGAAFFSAWIRAAEQHGHTSGFAAAPDTADFSGYEPQFFNADDFAALQSFTEILIPTDETPGAREAHCAHFIDFLLHSMESDAPETQHHVTQEQWRTAMAALKASGFHAAAPDKRLAIVKQITRPEQEPTARHPAFAAYRLIKRENAFAFYTARAGSIEALDYRGNTVNLQFPGCAHPEHQSI